MKKCLIIFVALSGVWWSGCKSMPAHKSATGSAAKTAAILNPRELAIDDAEENSDDAPTLSATPESLAHFAAGLSFAANDKNEQAVDQFYQSAISDPGNESLVIDVARRCLQKKQTQKALDLLKKSAARPTATGTIYGWLGRAYLQAGQTNAAIHASRTGILKSPDDLQSYQSLTHIYLKNNQMGEALKVLNQAAHHGQSDPFYLVNLSELYLAYLKIDPKPGDVVKAQVAVLLHHVAQLKPQSSRLLQRQAAGLEAVGDAKGAEQVYLSLLKVLAESSPTRDTVRERLANLYLQSGNKKDATAQLEAIVAENPTRYPSAWHYLGTIAYDEKHFSDAEKDFEKALQLDANIEQAYYDLALVQIDLQKTNDALRTLEKAQDKFPHTFVGEFFYGLAETRLKDYSEAVKHFLNAEKIAITNEPKRLNHQFYFQLGAACERNHDYKKAEEYFDKCLKQAPEFHEALNYLGYMWADRGENLDKARALIERAVKLEPKNAAYLDSLGWVFFKQNHTQQALAYLLKAQEYSGEPDPSILDHLGDVYMALHEQDKAREAWKKSIAIEPNDEIKKKLQQSGGAS